MHGYNRSQTSNRFTRQCSRKTEEGQNKKTHLLLAAREGLPERLRLIMTPELQQGVRFGGGVDKKQEAREDREDFEFTEA